jgi:hypothetical protein
VNQLNRKGAGVAGASGAAGDHGMGWPSLFKKFKGAEDNAVIHLESLLDHEKLKNQEGQQVYHKNEKVNFDFILYLGLLSKNFKIGI